MKRTVAVIFDIILALAAVTFIMCIWAKPVCTELVKEAYVEKPVKSKVLDVVNQVTKGVSDSDAKTIESAVDNSKVLDDITEKYLDSVAGNNGVTITEAEVNQYIDQLTDENMNIIEDKTGVELTNDQKNYIKNQIYSKSSQVIDSLSSGVEQVTSQMTPKQKAILKVYSILNSNILRFGLIFTMIVLGIAVILLRWKHVKWLFNIGISSTVAGVLTGGMIPMCVLASSASLTNRILGSTMDIPVDSLYVYGSSLAVAGIVLLIVYFAISRIAAARRSPF